MAEASQSFSNHTRYDPLFHFFILPIFAIALVTSIIHLIKWPGLHSALLVIFFIAAMVAVFKIRLYSLKVQDRVIRLEERLRLATLLDPALRSRIPEIHRVATDGASLRIRWRTTRARHSSSERKTIQPRTSRKAIQQWRPDNWRV